jgi:hypothetical protein
MGHIFCKQAQFMEVNEILRIFRKKWNQEKNKNGINFQFH